MRVFVAGVSSERQYVKALDSYYELIIREGDQKAHLFGRPWTYATLSCGGLTTPC